jgi:hypothetical protein
MSPLLFVHVALSLIGIATGLAVFYGLLTGKSHGGLIAVFLATTVLTSLTGFPLPETILTEHGAIPPRTVGLTLSRWISDGFSREICSAAPLSSMSAVRLAWS